MARAHDVLRRAMARGRARYDWHEVLGAAHAVVTVRSAESERVLRDLLKFPGEIGLLGTHGPHAMPAGDLLRSLAIQTLARWNHRRHRAAIARIHTTTGSHLLAEIARVHLKAPTP